MDVYVYAKTWIKPIWDQIYTVTVFLTTPVFELRLLTTQAVNLPPILLHQIQASHRAHWPAETSRKPSSEAECFKQSVIPIKTLFFLCRFCFFFFFFFLFIEGWQTNLMNTATYCIAVCRSMACMGWEQLSQCNQVLYFCTISRYVSDIFLYSIINHREIRNCFISQVRVKKQGIWLCLNLLSVYRDLHLNNKYKNEKNKSHFKTNMYLLYLLPHDTDFNASCYVSNEDFTW